VANPAVPARAVLQTAPAHAGGPPADAVPEGRAPAPATGQPASPLLQLLAMARDVAERSEPAGHGRDTGAVAGAGPAVVTGGVAHALFAPAARGDAGLAVPAPAGTLPVAAAPPQWAGELEARIHWLAGRNMRSADIRLDPPELGPLQVQVHAHRDGTSVHFTTHSALVRDLVEQSLPRLREMLESSGMNLVDVNVAQQDGGRGQRDAAPGRPAGAGGSHAQPEHPVGSVATVTTVRGLVDAYV
jgi:flagellar hook-length control protein FliK